MPIILPGLHLDIAIRYRQNFAVGQDLPAPTDRIKHTGQDKMRMLVTPTDDDPLSSGIAHIKKMDHRPIAIRLGAGAVDRSCRPGDNGPE